MTNPYRHTHDNGVTEIPYEVALTVAKLVEYSFEPIDYDYEGLTQQEKALYSREEFENLIKWVKNDGV